MSPKVDVKNIWEGFYHPSSKQPKIIKVPPLHYIAISGEGAPGADDFQDTFPALYGVAFTLKFMFKWKRPPKGWSDWKMTPPEALYWMKGNKPFEKHKKKDWRWAVMILMPDFITPELIKEAKKLVKEKKNPRLLPRLKLMNLNEGTCVTMMHIGPYDQVERTLKPMEAFAAEHGYAFGGKHHEIYLSRPNVKPEKIKTALRMPLKKLT